jgi:ABC-type molybdate transport system ATPase subunit
VAFVRPHDIVLRSLEEKEPSPDARLPGDASVVLVTALGPKAWVELSQGERVIAAEISRETMKDLQLSPGSRCAVHLRLPRFFSRADGAG